MLCFFFFFSLNVGQVGKCNLWLKIGPVNTRNELGLKYFLWLSVIFLCKILKKKLKYVEKLDVFLLRSGIRQGYLWLGHLLKILLQILASTRKRNKMCTDWKKENYLLFAKAIIVCVEHLNESKTNKQPPPKRRNPITNKQEQ